MRKTNFYFFLSTLILIMLTTLIYRNINFTDTNHKVSPELPSMITNIYSKGFKSKVVAASCGYSTAGHDPSDYTSCSAYSDCCYGGRIYSYGQSLCGGTCSATPPECLVYPYYGQYCNGPTDSCGNSTRGAYDTCGNCVVSSPNPNSPLYGQTCKGSLDSCGNYKTGTYNSCGVCVITSTDPTPCSKTNVCGQTFSGHVCNGTCNAGKNIQNLNNSCITSFKLSNTTINPNGSVDFSWKILPLRTGVKSTCGFVDLTTPTPRPIPGLQNLDSTQDKARITNIQATTRFCLVCQFYSTTNNASLGDATAHQWIKVIRVGEQ